MVAVRQAVGVIEVGARAAELGGALVHQGDEGVERAGYVDGYYVARLVGRAEHGAVHEVAQGHLLAGLNVGGAARVVHALYGLHTGRDCVVERGLTALYGLHGQQHRHDLGQRGGVALLVGIELIEHTSRVSFGYYSRGRTELRCLDRLGGQGSGGEGGEHKRRNQCQGKYLYFFHIHLRTDVVSYLCTLRARARKAYTIIHSTAKKSNTLTITERKGEKSP